MKVSGDGKADLLWLNKYTGDTTVWYNGGEIPTSGSHFKWDNQGVLYKAWDRGSNMNFGALGGQHRADIIQVIPRTNIAYISYNKCASGTGAGGDDPNMGDPGLPPYSRTGTCTNDDGNGDCEIDIGSTIGISFPPDTFLPPFEQSVSYAAGDALLFGTPIPSDLNLNLILTGGQTQWDDINCGLIPATGTDGDTLGCIAASVAWMTYSIYLDGGPATAISARSLSSSHYQFQVHSDWEPMDNCSMSCMLIQGTPQHTWTAAGNGTYHGIYHELHFMHSDNFTGHRAYQGGYPRNSTLVSRQSDYSDYRYSTNQLDSNLNPIRSSIYVFKDEPVEPVTYKASFDEYPSPEGLAEWMGESVEEAVAESKFGGFCFTLMNGGEVVSSTLLGVSQTGSEWGGTPDEVEQDLTNCAADMSNPNQHIGSVILVCGANLTWIDPSLLDDPDGNLNPDIWVRSLQKRVGDSKGYLIHNELDPTGMTITFESAPYVNGQNGQTLIDEGGDSHVYGLANRGNCTDTSIRSDTPIAGPNAVVVNAEHIIERVTMPYFFDFIQNPQLDLNDGNGMVRAPANLQAIPFNVIRDYMAIPYIEWPNFDSSLPLPPDQSLFSDMAQSLGSTFNVAVMTNLDFNLNGVKSRVWDTYRLVSSDDTWYPFANTPTVANTQSALELIRAVS